jgi:hypothetical protein
VNVCPPAVIVPVRALVLPFAAARYDTVPVPLPELPPVTMIQFAFDFAVHEQPVPAVIVNEPVPQAAPTLAFAGVKVNVQLPLGLNALVSAPPQNVRPSL